MVNYKAFCEIKSVPGTPSEEELELINRGTITPLKAEDVFTFNVIVCDNHIDRVGDVMTDEALEAIAEKSKSLIGVKDHVWDSENTFTRLYDAIVVADGSVNEDNGLPYKYVLGKAYTLRKFGDFVDKINSGILKEVSISFSSHGDTCSICGAKTSKRDDDRAVCENGHVALEVYDGVQCTNLVNGIDDTFEWSFVAVPCQRCAGVKAKKLGGKHMKKLAFLLSMSPILKSLSAEKKEELGNIMDTPADAEVDEKDIQALLERLDQLEAERDELKAKLEEAIAGKQAAEEAEAKRFKSAAVLKAVEDLNPLTEQVKSDILEKIDGEKVIIGESGEISGLQEQLDELAEKYKGLIGKACGEAEKKSEVPDNSGSDDSSDTGTEMKSKSFGVNFKLGSKTEVSKKISFHESAEKLLK